VLPKIVAGPDTTESVTGKPEVAVGAVTVKGTDPYVFVGIVVKGLIVWEVNEDNEDLIAKLAYDPAET
jgi:hypothetical protein